jgi:hypothetical protein
MRTSRSPRGSTFGVLGSETRRVVIIIMIYSESCSDESCFTNTDISLFNSNYKSIILKFAKRQLNL